MEVLVFDTETIPDRNLARPDEIEKANGESIFPKTPLHEVKVIAYARFVMENGIPVFKGAQAGGTAQSTEAELLAAFWGFVDKAHPLFVSWNGRSFDLQVLVHRAMVHRIPIPGYFFEQNKFERYRYRYSEGSHLDLMDTLTEFGAGTKFSLDLAARMVGAPGKIDTNGAAVEEMVKNGQIESARTYCVVDCLNLAAVWLRYLMIQARISGEQEDAIKASIIDWIGGQPESMTELKKFGRLWASGR